MKDKNKWWEESSFSKNIMTAFLSHIINYGKC